MDIENIVQKGYEYVIQLLSPLKIEHFVRHGQIITLKDLSDIISHQLEAFWLTKIELNEDSSHDSDINTHCTTLNDLNDYDGDDMMESDEDNDTIHVTNISGIQGIRVFDKVKPEREHTYFKVNINNQTKFLHKQTATWLLQKEKN